MTASVSGSTPLEIDPSASIHTGLAHPNTPHVAVGARVGHPILALRNIDGGDAMRRTALFGVVIGAFLLAGLVTVPSAQQPSGQLKPDGVPFNFNDMDMQVAPAAGVAVRAGKMFDAK